MRNEPRAGQAAEDQERSDNTQKGGRGPAEAQQRDERAARDREDQDGGHGAQAEDEHRQRPAAGRSGSGGAAGGGVDKGAGQETLQAPEERRGEIDLRVEGFARPGTDEAIDARGRKTSLQAGEEPGGRERERERRQAGGHGEEAGNPPAPARGLRDPPEAAGGGADDDVSRDPPP